MRHRTRLAPCGRLLAALGLMAVLLAPPGAGAQQMPTGSQPVVELSPLADDVYLFRHNTYQALFIVTGEGVIATDPMGLHDPRTPELYKAAIASITDQPVRYVVYGHDHQDHIAGGIVFADTAEFVSQRLAAPRIAARADPLTPVPTITFDQQLTLELGGKAVELHYPGRAHSDNDLVLLYPARRLAFVTDLVEPRSLPGMRGSSPDEYVAAMRWIEDNLDFDVLVAGHGPLGSKDTVRELREYLEDLIRAVQAARARGLADGSDAMLAAVRAELAPRYAAWQGFERRLASNVAAVIQGGPGS